MSSDRIYEDFFYEEVLLRISQGEPLYRIFQQGKNRAALPKQEFYRKRKEDPEFAHRVTLAYEMAGEGLTQEMIELSDLAPDLDRLKHQLAARKYAADRSDRNRMFRLANKDEKPQKPSEMLDVDRMSPESRELFMEFMAMRAGELEEGEDDE